VRCWGGCPAEPWGGAWLTMVVQLRVPTGVGPRCGMGRSWGGRPARQRRRRVADPKGFLRYERVDPPKRPRKERVGDWREVYVELAPEERDRQVRPQATRCMDCGIPFCHSGSAGCPLGNLIPEWNDLVRQGDWERAVDRLHATNNFPEFTGKLCPAPCEAACVLSISPDSGGAVSIKRVE